MLNENKERELAYVVKIKEIRPIPGKDRVECAVVNGWTVMVRKDQFKVNDFGIYFEIDSKTPEEEPFMFLSNKKFKIKTQRYKTPDGPFYSQGLLMSAEDFRWVNAPTGIYNTAEQEVYKEGDFLTNKLKITYAEAEDNTRKAKNDRYQSMKDRNVSLFKKWPYNKLMKTEWGRKLLFVFFGKKRDKKSEFPSYIRKTDEERCLPGPTKILTENGWIQISNIVNNKLPVKVASMNDDGTISYKNIVDYQKFSNTTPMVTIHYPYSSGCSRTNSICCTEDHKCFTNRGYVEAKDITISDILYTPTFTYSTEVLPAIYGMLLGDSHIAHDKRSNGKLRVMATNGEVQLDYLNYKRSIFNNEGKISNAGLGSFGKNPAFHWAMPVDATVDKYVRDDWYSTNKKYISDNVIDRLNDISLAFWYMDDGSLTYRNTDKTAYFIRLHTQGFSYDEIQKLSNMLSDKFGIINKINNDIIAADGHQTYRIDISSTLECDKFLKLVAPYICDSMLYKLPPKMRDRVLIPLSYKKSTIAFPIPIISVDKGQTKNKFWSKTFEFVYDIEVEDNHNFIADNIVVHNCQNMPWLFGPNGSDKEWIVTEKIDGTSSTFSMRGFGRKRKFYVCSRNVVFDKADKKGFYDINYYTDIATRYNMEQKLSRLLDSQKDVLDYVTIQGEIYGPGVQKRDYSMKDTDLAVFNIIYGYKDGRVKRFNPEEGALIAKSIGLPFVPVLERIHLPSTCEELLKYADGISKIDGGMREGVVLRDIYGYDSFKAVSQEYLMRYHNG